MKVLLTGANGFIGKNITLWLTSSGHEVLPYDINSSEEELINYVKECDFVVHLAGINRPLTNEEFYDGNVNFTKKLLDLLEKYNPSVSLIFSSSIQAESDNDYGKSKKMAESLLLDSPITTYVYRLSNVFGKWCRPNYNSVAATFCYNIAHDIEINISNPDALVHFVYIDDICEEFLKVINKEITPSDKDINVVNPIYHVTLKQLSDTIYSFKNSRTNLFVPSQSDEFTKKLYSTYLSYLPEDNFSYELTSHTDNRGSFSEFLKSDDNGQLSINVIRPGITKGNHYHHTKNEKFLVVSGKCSTKFRKINETKVIEYITSGDHFEVIDIPTGYTHNITNIGEEDAVVIMWANETFDPNHPDTFYEEV